MGVPPERIQADFDRIAAVDAAEWDHNRHYHGFLLRHLPARREAALEIGCGTGAFTRLLADRFARVVAVDLSSEMLRRAHERTRSAHNVELRQVDFAEHSLYPESLDCIAVIATLHHLPLEETLERMKGALRSGGVLLILDLHRNDGVADLALGALALPLDLALRAWKLGRFREPLAARDAWSAHAVHDVYPTLAEMRALAERRLPGAVVRRHLFWRYTLIWRKPV